jgi:hypothetical protein
MLRCVLRFWSVTMNTILWVVVLRGWAGVHRRFVQMWLLDLQVRRVKSSKRAAKVRRQENVGYIWHVLMRQTSNFFTDYIQSFQHKNYIGVNSLVSEKKHADNGCA